MIVVCAVSGVQGVNDISLVLTAAHVPTIPTYVLGNAFASTIHKSTCNYTTLLNTAIPYTHPYNLLIHYYSNLRHHNQVSQDKICIAKQYARFPVLYALATLYMKVTVFMDRSKYR